MQNVHENTHQRPFGYWYYRPVIPLLLLNPYHYKFCDKQSISNIFYIEYLKIRHLNMV